MRKKIFQKKNDNKYSFGMILKSNKYIFGFSYIVFCFVCL